MLSKLKIKKINSFHSTKGRYNEGKFLAEGPKVVSELLNEGIVTELFFTEQYSEFVKDALAKHVFNFSIITEKELSKISNFSTPNGLLAICKFPNFDFSFNVLRKSFSLYLDGIKDPGNLGTIVRVCDWFGINNIVCSLDTVDCFNSKVIQSSMGSIARVQVHYMDFKKFYSDIKNFINPDFQVFAATLDGKNAFKFKFPEFGVLIIGSESHGVSNDILSLVKSEISIPKRNQGRAESLNAASAASIIISEWTKNKFL